MALVPLPPGFGTPADEPFFRERSQRAPHERRSLARGLLLAGELGLPVVDLHPLVIVGSKGKGTAATHAAAMLRGEGLSVGLVTSPAYRSNHERIRLDGRSIADRDYVRLAARVAAALDRLPPRRPGSGYVSPTGAFTLAGLAWLCDRGCDALVVEAGIGGASDESSLTRPSVVAITEVFEEHLGILGDDAVEIAREKAGTINAATRHVLSVPQRPEVRQAVDEAAGRHGLPVEVLVPEEGPAALDKLLTRLARTNAHLGLRAAHRYLDVLGRHPAATRPLDELAVPDVRLPGRLSVHRQGRATWVVDAAISPHGVRAALDWCRHTLGEPTAVLLSIPDSKDRPACQAALAGAAVQPLRVDVPHLAFTPSPGGASLPTLADVDHRSLGDLVLALGTVSFVGEVLDLLEVDVTRLF